MNQEVASLGYEVRGMLDEIRCEMGWRVMESCAGRCSCGERGGAVGSVEGNVEFADARLQDG